MDKKTGDESQTEGARADEQHAGGDADTIEASGDAIIISDAIQTLAAGFRELAAAIRQVSAPAGDHDETDEDEQGRYLDGTPIKK